jgi:hypothetical protein
MKNYTFKKLASSFFIVLSISTAFVNGYPKTAKRTIIQGYIRNNTQGTICQQAGLCADVVSQLCTVNGLPGGTQLWGKSAAGMCTIELYKIPN